MNHIARTIITSTFVALPLLAQAQQSVVRCQQPDGKFIYQNWPCGTKPPVERQAPAKPDYNKVLECGMRTSAENVARRAAGVQPLPSKCADSRS